MHNAVYELPRILIPRTRLNRGKKQSEKGRSAAELSRVYSSCEPSFLVTDHYDGAVGVPDDGVGNATHQRPLHPTEPPAARHHQVCL
jgi:hypothetical protein